LILILKETANGVAAEDADYVKLYCQMPPIAKMDNALISLKNCECVINIISAIFIHSFNILILIQGGWPFLRTILIE